MSIANTVKLRLSLLTKKTSVIAVSEVKPKNFRFDRTLSEYNLDGYEMLTLNLCKNDAGRGMILYIDSCVKYSPINN